MFRVQTFIKRPGISIINLSSLSEKESNYLINISNEEELIRYGNQFDFTCLEGAIKLEYYGEPLLDVSAWDVIDGMWLYLLDAMESLKETGYGEMNFSDQALVLTLKSASEQFVLYILHTSPPVKVVLPTQDFFIVVLEGAEQFF
ncbi:hypothetical protein [Priestia aryabhattai]|uniref:hypothetical protein n=1 Tax=Priestia aryabhattai TaxID=412384 RepID=UPI001ADC9F43|nr:hypothetical protein [Priestia aryabhattai]QTL47244.1 hypothetical protein J5Z55_14130 [Priestia aryabhattai]